MKGINKKKRRMGSKRAIQVSSRKLNKGILAN